MLLELDPATIAARVSELRRAAAEQCRNASTAAREGFQTMRGRMYLYAVIVGAARGCCER